MKLYPPIIEGIIPAFCGSILRVPFTMNKSVSENQVKGFSVKIKTVQSNYPICELNTLLWSKEKNEAIFIISSTDGFNIGQFYKLQMAYVYQDEGQNPIIGHYSSVGIVKYTSEPVIELLEEVSGNMYIGSYITEDITERIHTYSFTLKDSKGSIIETSGEKLHDASADTKTHGSIDTYIIKTDLEKNKTYYLDYSVKTVNGLQISAETKTVSKSGSIDSNLKTKIDCKLDYENGCINIDLVKPDDMEMEKAAVGSFYLLRSSDEDNFTTWEEVSNFVLYGQNPSRHLWKDMTIKQGIKYKYAVQQYNSHGLRSNRIESEIILADFEHIFLYDGERQLKIKYNPKIASFKNTVLESKIDTIGSKHPFIFRNGNVSYKEFPISGLISYLSDENDLFYNTSSYFDIDQLKRLPNNNSLEFKSKGTNLISDNIFMERNFKLEVLDWLTNGKPKLFRSPTEGNYIVRLLNVSLSPSDEVGRMIHTFNCTAYEISESNYSNLKEYNFINTNISIQPQLRVQSIDLSKIKIKNEENLLQHTASSLLLEGMLPGDKFKIKTRTDEKEQDNLVVIGSTGRYIIDLKNNVKILSLSFQNSANNDEEVLHQGILTYGYYSTDFKDSFDTIRGIQSYIVPCQQFIGEYDNILEEIETIKDRIDSINFIKFKLRNDDVEIYRFNNEYYSDEKATNIIDLKDLTNIYKVNVLDENKKNTGEYYWLDGYNTPNENGEEIRLYSESSSNTKIILNGLEKIDIKDTGYFELRDIDNIKTIKTGAAIITEICYSKKKIEYDLEDTDKNLLRPKLIYETSLQLLENGISDSKTSRKQLKELQDDCRKAYFDYTTALEIAIQEAERR